MKKTLFIIYIIFTLSINTLSKKEQIINFVNKLSTTWKSKLYNRGDISFSINFLPKKIKNLPEKKIFYNYKFSLPENYDLREIYPQCDSIKDIEENSECPASWAMIPIQTMSDRICIYSKGQIKKRLSVMHILTCCTSCGSGCSGGYPSYVFNFWVKNGIPTGGPYGDKNCCKPFLYPPLNNDNNISNNNKFLNDYFPCENKCQEGYNKTVEEDKIYGSSAYSVKGEENIMSEIFENGSVSGIMTVYEDFLNYKSGIYQHITGSSIGGLNVRIIGWGIENGIKYWIVVNTWGKSWGENGFFRVLRGRNECGIENSVNAGLPKI